MKEHPAELEKANEVQKLPDKESKMAEEILRASEEKYRNMIELFPAVIVVINKLGFIVSCNSALKRITGYSENELVGKHFTKLDAFKLKDVPKNLGLFAKALKGELSNPVEIDFTRRDGSNGTVEVLVNLLNDGKILAIAIDITERKKAEERMLESENRYKAVVNNAIEGITVVQDNMLKFVNPRLVAIAGYSEKELTSRSFLEFIHPDDQEWVMKIHLKRFKNETVPPVYEFKIIDKQGNIKWLENNGILIEWKAKPATLNFLRDITERKRAEEALKREKKLNDQLFKTTPAFAVAINAKGKTVMMNESMLNALGYTSAEIKGADYLTTFVPVRDRERLAEKFEILTKTKESVAIENYVITKDSQELLVDWRGSQIFNSEGKLEFFFGVGIDITERKKAEDALRESEEKFRTLAEQSPNMIFINKKGVVVYANKKCEELMGYKRDLFYSPDFDFFTLIAPESHDSIKKSYSEHMKGNDFEPFEYTLVTKEGKRIEAIYTSKLITYEGDNAVLGIITDITERKKAEENLLDYQVKLKSLASQLTLLEERERRRIATELHDQIGQSLVFTKIKLDELQQSATTNELTETLNEICNIIKEVIQDTRTLTFDLGSPILYELGFEAAVSDWLIGQVRDKHGIKTEFQDDGQLKPLDEDIQAVLFRNVRELLTNVVKHANAQNVRLSVSKVNEQICVIIEDDGVGFNTSEVASKATFGLFSIRERLEQLGGNFKVESELGHGSKITMKAPLKLT